jgi:hypothetical protein
MAELSVEISAKIDKLEKELAKAKGEFKSLENSAAKTSNKLGKSSASASKGINKLGKSAISGGSAMTAFSRTVQDAPFGLMGVSNNITNLTEQFGYLKSKTGSAGGALKAMLRDLKGFGGVTLAISLVTSALLMFGDKIFQTKDKAKELRDEQEKLTKSLEDYVNGLESVSRANLEGERSAQKELVTLGLLRSQIENTTLSTNERKNAIDELRKKYPDYLQNMSDENILNGGLASTYDTLTKSILKRAKATAATNMIIKNSEKLLTIESQIAAKQVEAENKQIELTKQKAKAHKTSTNVMVGGAGSYNQKLVEQKKLEKELKDIIDSKNILIGQKQTLELTNIDLEGNIDTTDLFKGVGVGGGIKEIFVDFKEVYKKEKEDFQELIETDPIILADIAEGKSVDWEAYFNAKKAEEEALRLKEILNKFNQDASSIISNSLVHTFSGIGRAIGDALNSGSNLAEGLGKSLLSGVGGMLTQLGQLAIGVGIGIKGIKLALKSLNPAAAIGAGIALVALGSAFKSGASKIGSSSGSSGSSGGRASSNTSTFSPSGGGSFSGSSGGGLQNVVFEIQGTKLVGVLSNTLARNKNLGGSLSLT